MESFDNENQGVNDSVGADESKGASASAENSVETGAENSAEMGVGGEALGNDRAGAVNGAENVAENSEFKVTGAMESEKTVRPEPEKRAFFERENEAQRLNKYLFEANGGEKDKKPFKDNVRGISPIWRFVALALVLVIVAFSGALAGVIYVCESSVFKDSEFFDAFIAKWAGVTENRVDVEYISGEYRGDAINLAKKTLASTVMVRVGARNNKGTFVESDSGSGVIYAHPENTDTYYVVTNHHVVYDSKEILIEIYDESVSDKRDNRFLGTIKYLDEMSDLAVLEFECEKELAVATQADSSKATYGQSIIVAGNPLGHGFAVSLGYVSNPLRITAANNNVPLIVMDISVNPGNSGGGLYDAAGNLLGIVTSKASGTDVDGIGYAVPINTVNGIVNDLLTHGYVRGRAAIGIKTVGIFNPTSYFEYQAGELNGHIFSTETRHYGVYVLESSSPLIKKGDRIISVDGEEITATVDIQKILLNKKPGGTVKVVLESASMEAGASEPTYSVRTVTVLLVERNFSDPASDQSENEV